MKRKANASENPPASGGMEELDRKDEALFEALGRSKKKKRRRRVRTVLLVVLALAVLLTAGVVVLRQRVREQFASDGAEVQSYVAATGTISTVVSGSGLLENVDTQIVTVPDGVEITEVLAEYGNAVSRGDLLARVDMATVRTALSELQSRIEDLDGQLRDAEGDQVSAYVKAGVSGRVKQIYAEKDAAVADTMAEYGALAVLSLDGHMALDLQTDALAPGDSVSVVRAEGDPVTGTVESAAGGTATILVTDNGPRNGETVTVLREDGTELGSAELYIHSPLSVTGYAGTVGRVNVSENQTVYSGSILLTLTDTGTSAAYDALLRTRREAEQTLLELLEIQRSGGVPAPLDGSVCSVGDPDAGEVVVLSPDISMSVTITVDESDILSLELGQEADVQVSSVSEETLTGTVTEIDKSASDGAYTAMLTLEKQAGMLPGMTASADVRIEGVDNAVIIPVDALHKTSTTAYVYTSYDEQTGEYGGRVDVVTGLSNSKYVEIKSGLSAGDTVYYTEEVSFPDLFGSMSGGRNGGMRGGETGDLPSGGFGGEKPVSSGGERPAGFGG